jgi:hypothetical protein
MKRLFTALAFAALATTAYAATELTATVGATCIPAAVEQALLLT